MSDPIAMPPLGGEITINGLKLVLTCSACPEQYDVTDGRGREAGYLRLRHGVFAAEYPKPWGERVYVADTDGDGLFETDAERGFHLRAAVAELRTARRNERLKARKT